jgi:hypothetical protein
MRILLSGLLAAGLLVNQIAVAAEPCARAADRSAFDVEGLKSVLMVTALTCGEQARYNSFVSRYRPALISHQHALHGYFSRSYGRRAQQQHDEYITQLANAQSNAGLKLGTALCQQNIGMFDEVMALSSDSQLAPYAASKKLEQPIALAECVGPEKPIRPTVRKASMKVTRQAKQ